MIYLVSFSYIVFSYKFSQKARKISSIQSPNTNDKAETITNTLDIDDIITSGYFSSTLNMDEKEIKEFLIEKLSVSTSTSSIMHGSNLNIQVRDIKRVGARYNIFEYIGANNRIHHILSIRGTRTLKNFRGLVKTNFVDCEALNIRLHAGFYEVYEAIFEDYMRLYGNKLDDITISLNGHSLGGAVSCLFGAALVLSGGKVDKITTFGMPKFTDMVGSMRILFLLQNGGVILNRVQHVLDPVGRVPMSLPSRDSYQHLVSGNFILLDPFPIERKEREGGESLPASLSSSLSAYLTSRRRNKDQVDEEEMLEDSDSDYLWMDDVNEIDKNDEKYISSNKAQIDMEQTANIIGYNDPMSILQDFDWRGRRITSSNSGTGGSNRIVQENRRHRVWLDQEADERVRMVIKDAPKFSLQWHYMYQYLHVLEKVRKES